MIPMLPTLLIYISNKGLPCSAKIEVRLRRENKIKSLIVMFISSRQLVDAILYWKSAV